MIRAGDPLVVRGRGGAVRFPSPVLLAPMEGVTDRGFRGLVLDLGDAGGACTEFVRLTTGAPSVACLRRELGPAHGRAPVGLQIMAPGAEFVAETAARATAAGAAWVDLNFGCPVRRVFDRCAGAALLDHPERLAAIVAAAVSGTPLPVSAKVRAGVRDDSRLEEIVLAAAGAGAAMITVHSRLRVDSYADPAPRERIARAVAAVARLSPRPVIIGNGGIDRAEDVEAMRAETGCDGVMIGRAAMADPWIFREAAGGPPASAGEARLFVLRYAASLRADGGRGTGRLKQLLRVWRAGGLFAGREGERAALLREPDAEAILAWFRGGAPIADVRACEPTGLLA